MKKRTPNLKLSGRKLGVGFWRPIMLLCAAVYLTLAGFRAYAQTTTTLVPVSYSTTSGGDNAQPVGSSIDLLDESGTTNTWSKYVQFQSRTAGVAYVGTRNYNLSTSVVPGNITNIQVKINYLGPLPSVQTLTWSIYNWSTGSWVSIGTNAGVQGWAGWTTFTLQPTGTPANYVRASDGLIQLRTVSNNTADDANIDYEAVLVTYTPASDSSYYVSPLGSDSNSGSLSSPWKTAQKAANTVGPGATVYFRAGTYSQFDVNVSGSAAGGYITFTNYPGENAIIDGTGYTGSYDHGLIDIEYRNYIKIIGFEIRNASSSTTSFSPAGVVIKGSGSYIQILNCHIHDIQQTASSNGNAHGLLVRGEDANNILNNISIIGNEINSCVTGWSESLTVAGNTQYFTVANNTVHDNNNIGIDCTGLYSGMAGQARNGTVNGNTIYNCSTVRNPYYNTPSCAGLYVDGGTGITLERNSVHNCDYGVQISSENPGQVSSYVTVRSNLVYQNAVSGIGIGGYKSSGVGGTDHCTFVNNTLYSNDTNNWWGGEVHIGWTVTNNLFENNIIYAGSQNIFVKDVGDDGSPVGSFDYNEYFSTGGAAGSKWQWIGQTTWTNGFSAWQSTTGQDAHSSYADPLFVSTGGLNFDTSSGSPARDTGINLGAAVGTLDYARNPRIQGVIDRGAYEH